MDYNKLSRIADSVNVRKSIDFRTLKRLAQKFGFSSESVIDFRRESGKGAFSVWINGKKLKPKKTLDTEEKCRAFVEKKAEALVEAINKEYPGLIVSWELQPDSGSIGDEKYKDFPNQGASPRDTWLNYEAFEVSGDIDTKKYKGSKGEEDLNDLVEEFKEAKGVSLDEEVKYGDYKVTSKDIANFLSDDEAEVYDEIVDLFDKSGVTAVRFFQNNDSVDWEFVA